MNKKALSHFLSARVTNKHKLILLLLHTTLSALSNRLQTLQPKGNVRSDSAIIAISLKP